MNVVKRQIDKRRVMLAVLSSLVLLMSAIGHSGLFQEAYAAVTYKRFDGVDDYVNVPSSSSLKLTKFSVEVRFRTSHTPTEWAFLANKGSSSGSVMKDVNYGMFITKEGKIGAGFKASDGTYHFIYSTSTVNDGTWNKAKITYTGSALKLHIDGTLDKSKSVSKTPDTLGTEPLRMGASANALKGFYKGDIDFVKIRDLKTSTTVYFNDFDGSSSDCSKLPAKSLVGVVFMDPILSRNEKGDSFSAPSNYVSQSMKYIKSYGFKTLRVPYYWESYAYNPTAFMNEIDLIAKTAQENNICVFFDNHHFYTTSYWKLDVEGKSDGRGFPSFVVKDYPNIGNDYIKTAGPFWKDFLSNAISISGKKVWTVQAEFFAKIIQKVDSYNSVVGYEILNEPHLFDESQYEKLGDYHTYMAKKIRSMTDKKIFFDRETTRGFERQPSKEHLIVPEGVSNLVYAPHLYSVPNPGSQGEKQLNRFETWAEEWGVEVLIGEWGADTLEDNVTFLKAFKENDFGGTAHSWKKSGSTGLGSTLYQSDTVEATIALVRLLDGYELVY